MEEITGLLVGDSLPFSHSFPEDSDLLVYHVAQPQSPGHGPCGVLRRQDLLGQIQMPNHLQKGKAHNRRNPSPFIGRFPDLCVPLWTGRLRTFGVGHE